MWSPGGRRQKGNAIIDLRPAHTRGHANHGWLDSWHTFPFADYYDSKEMGYGTLRVINDDRLAPGGGFPTHGHRDMKIVTYILEAALEHKDSLGNGSVITPGEVQRMSAGKGILHSEYNPSADSPVHLLQIWIQPATPGLAPGFEQKRFKPAELQGCLRLMASPLGCGGSMTINQDTDKDAARLSAGEGVNHVLGLGRVAYLHVARGALTSMAGACRRATGRRSATRPDWTSSASMRPNCCCST